MWWNFSRKPASAGRSRNKTRKLRLESLERRQMLSVSPIGHLLHGPVSPGQPETSLAALHGPSSPSLNEPMGLLYGPFSPGRHGPIGPGHFHHRVGMSQSITTEETTSLRDPDWFMQETARVNAKTEANGVTRVAIDVTEDVYAGSHGGRLIAKEDVRVVANVKGAGNFQIDVDQCESVVARSGRWPSVENLTQSVDVNVDISAAGHLQIEVHESELLNNR